MLARALHQDRFGLTSGSHRGTVRLRILGEGRRRLECGLLEAGTREYRADGIDLERLARVTPGGEGELGAVQR